ncbi:hypothetical protein CIB48_g3369 [Xylaria polymorpha]|nr:hypothetical protein CIB48_g3369 [Xylaria polymorpha]
MHSAVDQRQSQPASCATRADPRKHYSEWKVTYTRHPDNTAISRQLRSLTACVLAMHVALWLLCSASGAYSYTTASQHILYPYELCTVAGLTISDGDDGGGWSSLVWYLALSPPPPSEDVTGLFDPSGCLCPGLGQFGIQPRLQLVQQGKVASTVFARHLTSRPRTKAHNNGGGIALHPAAAQASWLTVGCVSRRRHCCSICQWKASKNKRSKRLHSGRASKRFHAALPQPSAGVASDGV